MNNQKVKKIIIKPLESILVVGYILFEELIWDVFAKPVYKYFKSLIVFDSLKKTFLGMNRHLLLFTFIFILAIVEFLGLFSAFCIINGYFYSGIIVYASKIPIAAFTFWLFELTKDKLMTFNWLKISYEYIMNLIEKYVNSDIHVYIKTRIVSLKAQLKQLKLKYFDKEGFIASIKKHYLVFKPHFLNKFEKKSLPSK
jgi:hypothetical protein